MGLRIGIYGFWSQDRGILYWVSGFGSLGLGLRIWIFGMGLRIWIFTFGSQDLDLWVLGLRISISRFGSKDLDHCIWIFGIGSKYLDL